jgi:hypothetical protein
MIEVIPCAKGKAAGMIEVIPGAKRVTTGMLAGWVGG